MLKRKKFLFLTIIGLLFRHDERIWESAFSVCPEFRKPGLYEDFVKLIAFSLDILESLMLPASYRVILCETVRCFTKAKVVRMRPAELWGVRVGVKISNDQKSSYSIFSFSNLFLIFTSV